MYDYDDGYGLTEDERKAGVGQLLRARSSYSSRSSRRSDYPINHGKRWSSCDIDHVYDAFLSGDSIRDIAYQLDRTPYAIAYKLHDMDLISGSQKRAVKDGYDDIYYTTYKSNHYRGNITSPSVTTHTKNENLLLTNSTKEIKELLAYDVFSEDLPPRKSNNDEELGLFSFFFMVWFAVILINQIFLFRACFQIYCLIAAVPHTFIISAVITAIWHKSKNK